MTFAIDLFAGGGGIACAMRQLGVTARHVEIDTDACDTLTAAGFVDVVRCDVRDPSWHPRRRVDLLHGSPPCPIYARPTRPERRAAAPDGWPWMLDAIKALRPTCVTVENVRFAPVDAWVRDLQHLGYHTAAFPLDAENFGAPQTRRRQFIVASTVKTPRRPEETHGAGGLLGRPLRGLRECLDPVGERHVYPYGTGRAASEPWRLDIPSPTVTCSDVKGTRASKGSGWRLNGGPDRMSDALFLALGWRRANVSELARAQGFPEGHPFRGSSEAQYRQAGNAVEVNSARVVLVSALETVAR